MSKKAHVLYIEDNEGIARLLQKRLTRAGYTISIAPDGEAGLQKSAIHPYDVILVDYNLPGMNGVQVITQLTTREVMLPIIMLTGTGNEQIAVEALKLGAEDYVVKDIDGVYFELLPAVIEQALKNKQLREDKLRAEVRLQANIAQLQTLQRIDDELTRKLDTKYVQTLALNHLLNLSGADAGSIAIGLHDGDIEIYSVGYSEGPDQAYFALKGESVVARVLQQRRAEWVMDVGADADYVAIRDDMRAQMVMPLVSQTRLMGVVSLETNRPEKFDGETFEFLKLVSTRVAVAVDNAQLYDTSQKQVAELKRLYEQVSALEQLKTDMIQIVSHDLLNPLTILTASVDLIERTLAKPAAGRAMRYLKRVRHAAEQMRNLIRDVLSLENIERLASGESYADEIDLLQLIGDICEDFRIRADQKGLTLHFATAVTAAVVVGNTAELEQAVSNLVSNAVKYTPEGGQIDVMLEVEGQRARFQVVDTGYGIPAEQQAALFQQFKRIRTAETQDIEGTGLGLYIVKQIVERYGGELIFSSEYGQGSTFGFTLPIKVDKEQEQEKE